MQQVEQGTVLAKNNLVKLVLVCLVQQETVLVLRLLLLLVLVKLVLVLVLVL